MTYVVVTGTGTEVGKTIVSAALASNALALGHRVAVVKPYQTGVGPDEPGDLAVIAKLTGVTDLHEYVRYSEALAPGTAARRLGETGLDAYQAADQILALADRDYVIVEGSGGLMVQLNRFGQDLTDVIHRLPSEQVHVILVASAGLGTLNVTAMTARILEQETGHQPDSVIVGSWPDSPGLAERCNLIDLSRYADCRLGGVLPARAGSRDPADFAKLAVSALAPDLAGRFDAEDFIARNTAPPPQSKGS